MITWPDCNLAVTQLNQLLLQSLCSQHWYFYGNYWVTKIYEQWLNNRHPLSNRLLESSKHTTWKYIAHRIPEIPRYVAYSLPKSNNKARAKATKTGSDSDTRSVTLTLDLTRPKSLTRDPKTRFQHGSSLRSCPPPMKNPRHAPAQSVIRVHLCGSVYMVRYCEMTVVAWLQLAIIAFLTCDVSRLRALKLI